MGGQARLNGRPAHARARLERPLDRLDTDHIGLHYLYRAEPTLPIEDSR